MTLVNKRLITGTYYFISIGAAVNYYTSYNPHCRFSDMLESIYSKIDRGEISIACPLPTNNESEYYALHKEEGRYYFVSEPVFRSRPRSLASQL